MTREEFEIELKNMAMSGKERFESMFPDPMIKITREEFKTIYPYNYSINDNKFD